MIQQTHLLGNFETKFVGRMLLPTLNDYLAEKIQACRGTGAEPDATDCSA